MKEARLSVLYNHVEMLPCNSQLKKDPDFIHKFCIGSNSYV